jgi:zinc-binding alcohol dehydrogenase/oxidoreductase
LFTKGKAKAGSKVLVVGAGSGTGTFAVQFAVAAGCQVFVTSGTGEKIERARQLGAAAGVSYKAQDWADELKHMAGGFDVVIDSALGNDFAKIPALCNPGARIVFFGATAGAIPELDPRVLFSKQIQLLGTMMGSQDDFKAMLEMINTHQLIPVVDEVFALDDAQQAVDKMGKSSQFGKLVLSVS